VATTLTPTGFSLIPSKFHKTLVSKREMKSIEPYYRASYHSNKMKQETPRATSFKLHPIVMTHKKVPHAM
jgi:hypothetical protein